MQVEDGDSQQGALLFCSVTEPKTKANGLVEIPETITPAARFPVTLL